MKYYPWDEKLPVTTFYHAMLAQYNLSYLSADMIKHELLILMS